MSLISLQNLTKTYPGVIANDAVSFDIDHAEIHALLGENGAGKSTLVKMIYGLVKPDSGTITFQDKPFAPREPRAARKAGVAMVFQHFSLFEALSVAENIALGMEKPPKPAILSDQIREVSVKYGLTLDPERLVGDLSVGERQRVEIIRCLLQEPKLFIMDEPTSVLTPQEVQTLFETLRRLRDEGTSILYISHKLEEIKQLCQRATVLRGGKVVATCTPSAETAKSMAEMMVGTKLTTPQKIKPEFGQPLLRVQNLSVKSADPFGTSLVDINFTLRAGEIMGIAGVAGNGQDELMLALSGEIRTPPASVQIEGGFVGQLGPAKRRQRGLLSAPEERLGHAAAPDMTLTENVLLSAYHRQNLGRRGFIDFARAQIFAQGVIKRFDVRTPSAENSAKSLSGGNLQKFVVGREVMQNPRVFVVNQPTWGVDAAAAAAIRQSLLELAMAGAGVLVISQDLDELMEVSHSFAVLSEGRLSPPRDAEGITVEEIGLLMGGAEIA
ncbi:ABC transporter [Amylibacter marinus]|uniref:ABC transporter n=1 Tax=Amylibacter marinus TaxID=1475483 RepID=A0ABQ5VV69_9RHOB|nr:ABC transporter ATP-binding protein [Amylibacter marinus]GLQ35199.1 ABC transporter [Amylibacter marinus]